MAATFFLSFHFSLPILIIISSVIIADETGSELKTLKLVQILFRHGDREPDTKFSGGVGRLTSLGKRQMYNLGLKLRDTYNDNLIGKKEFDPAEILMVSSDKDRTIQSLSTLAYGLYKDFNLEATWNFLENGKEKIPFEPIPVRTVPMEYDQILQVTASCPRRDELWATALKNMEENFIKNHKDLYDYYHQHKRNDPKFLDEVATDDPSWYNQMILEQERLLYNKDNNLNLPDWTLPLFEIEAYTRLKSQLSRNAMSDPEYKKLYTGSLVQLLIDGFNDKDENHNNRKLILFSGHDRTIFYLLIALNLDDTTVPSLPPSGTAFIMELHQEETDSEPFLTFWYRNDTDSGYNGQPHLLKVPNCGHPCTLKTFVELTQNLIPTNLDFECQSRGSQQQF